MIARLRRRHRLFFVVLAVGLGPLLYAALSSRSSPPSGDLPTPLTGATQPAEGTMLRPFADQAGDFQATDVVVGPAAITVRLGQDLRSPDVLAYWSAETPADRLPSGAVLLGALSAGRANVLPRPPGAGGEGSLIFYSLGHQEIVASAPLALPAIPDPSGAPTEESEPEDGGAA